MLPLTRVVLLLAGPIIGGVLLFVCSPFTGLWEPQPFIVLMTAAAAAAGALLAGRAGRCIRPTERVVLIGSERLTAQLRRELNVAGDHHYELLGYIAEDSRTGDPEVNSDRLGTLTSLDALVQEHRIDLLLVACSPSRGAVFERISECFLRQPVRVCELAQFCEDTFGHVPEADIDAEWFRYIMHRALTRTTRRPSGRSTSASPSSQPSPSRPC